MRADELLQSSGLQSAEARALLAFVLEVPRESLIARPQQSVAAEAVARFRDLCARRQRGEPMAYLLRQREFFGHLLRVDPAVLIPRPETECLVEAALQLLEGVQAPKVVDLGTGSGCIAIAIALQRRDAHVCATDLSSEALPVARRNAEALGACIEFVHGDWFDAVGDRRFDLIVSNPPYIAQGDAHLDDLTFEPPTALCAGADGLACLRSIIRRAPQHLSDGASLLVEHGFDQGSAVRDLMLQQGLRDVQTRRDLAGLERIGIGRRC